MTRLNKTAPAVELTSDGADTLRYSEHGTPSPLIRWHLHDDHELHLITATTGKFFVGDGIGAFEPGQLILTGPRLPHNWLTDPEHPPVEQRDRLIHFDGQRITRSLAQFPEFAELGPLWEKAKYGIEFLGRDLDRSHRDFDRLRDSQGLERLLMFLDLLLDLSRWPHYRLLSTVQIDEFVNEAAQRKINTVIDHVFTHYAKPITLGDVAALVGMSENYFSSFFRKTTGNRFVEFLNRVRISRACTLLAETDRQITHICYDVGFNNVANFNRRFHELKGVTPSEYRHQVVRRHEPNTDI